LCHRLAAAARLLTATARVAAPGHRRESIGYNRGMSIQSHCFKILLAVAIAFGLAACAPKFNRPNVTVVNVELRSGNLLQQNFAVKLNVQNPNERALPVKALHVELRVDGEQIASGVSDRAFEVPANGETDFDMSIKANMAVALLKLANRMNQHAESMDYDLTGGATIDLPFLHELPFHQTGSFSLAGFQ
jgi:LEA14-like dessication related protein